MRHGAAPPQGTMLDMALDARDQADDAVRSLLIARAQEAQRLASWIL